MRFLDQNKLRRVACPGICTEDIDDIELFNSYYWQYNVLLAISCNWPYIVLLVISYIDRTLQQSYCLDIGQMWIVWTMWPSNLWYMPTSMVPSKDVYGEPVSLIMYSFLMGTSLKLNDISGLYMTTHFFEQLILNFCPYEFREFNGLLGVLWLILSLIHSHWAFPCDSSKELRLGYSLENFSVIALLSNVQKNVQKEKWPERLLRAGHVNALSCCTVERL